MRILLATSELHPFSKTGGLADMVAALAKALARSGHRVGVVTPLYRGIRVKFPAITRMDWEMQLALGDRYLGAAVYTLEAEPNLTLYFIDQPEFYDRPGVYGEQGVDYADNAARFIFFDKAVLHLARYLPWQPELVHTHDWQTGLIPAMMKHQQLAEEWNPIPATCHTIHNLAYQGVFHRNNLALTNLPTSYFTDTGIEFYTSINCLKAGIVYADVLTTVSPRYAREITTEAYGCGLDGVLRKRQEVLFGILNGVDYDEWRTQGNPHLVHAFGPDDLSGKRAGKLALQKEIGLEQNADVPLFGTISRLVDQKGIDISLGALEEMMAAPMQFVVLGNGHPAYEKAFQKLARRYPKRLAAVIGFDTGLSHRIEAACDFYLMPSRFEPCGLNQMYSLHYGAIPIVRVTGGLDDSVIDIGEDFENANGIKFSEYSVRALSRSIRKALVLYQEDDLLNHYRQNGMRSDFSWEKTAQEYETVFLQAINGSGR